MAVTQRTVRPVSNVLRDLLCLNTIMAEGGRMQSDKGQAYWSEGED